MKKAVIIADYGENTGTGHMMRCGVLAKELSGQAEVTFICQDNDYFEAAEKIAVKNSAQAIKSKDVWSTGKTQKADILIVDSYNNPAAFFSTARNIYDVCVIVDDNNLLPFYDADIIVNQNIGAEKRVYRTRTDATLLLGAKYAMLSEAFLAKEPIDISKEVKNVAVTLGGADLKNTTEKVLEMLKEHKNFTYQVAVGSAFGNKKALAEIADKAPNIVLHENADMAELLSGCQAAISACGTTVYELAVLGVPTVGIVTADNQRDVSICMEDQGIILCAGLEEKLSSAYFSMLFSDITSNEKVRAEMHSKQLNVVARGGAKRVRDSIVSKLEQ